MNRFDPVSAQLAVRPRRLWTGFLLRGGTWIVPAAAVLISVWRGIVLEANPTDQIARSLAELPLCLVLVDLWGLGIALLRRSARTPLRVPVRTPIILAGLHLALWLWLRHLVVFDVFYRLVPVDDTSGVYEVRWGITLLLGVLSLVGLVAAFLEVRLVRWVIISEDTAAVNIEGAVESAGEPDMPAGPEHVYEAQVLLHNLGYEAGPIDGEMKDETREALKRFQASCRLAPSGEITMLTMIELRNRWAAREAPQPGQSLTALFRHLIHRMRDWWEKRRG